MTLILTARHFHDNENEPDRISVSDETSWLTIIVNSNQWGWPARASVQLYDLTFDLPSSSVTDHINVQKISSDGFDEHSRLTSCYWEADNNWKLNYNKYAEITIFIFNHDWLILIENVKPIQ